VHPCEAAAVAAAGHATDKQQRQHDTAGTHFMRWRFSGGRLHQQALAPAPPWPAGAREDTSLARVDEPAKELKEPGGAMSLVANKKALVLRRSQ